MKNFKIHLDLSNNTFVPSMRFYDSDINSSSITAYITNNKAHFDLSTHITSCYVRRADGKIVTIPVNIINTAGGVVDIPIPSSLLKIVGEHTVQLVISKSGAKYTTQQFKFTVEESINSGIDDDLAEQSPLLKELVDRVSVIEVELINSYSNSEIDNLLVTTKEAIIEDYTTKLDNYVKSEDFVSGLETKVDIRQLDDELEKLRDIYTSKSHLESVIDLLKKEFNIEIQSIHNSISDMNSSNAENFKAVNKRIDVVDEKIDNYDIPLVVDDQVDDILDFILNIN